MVIPGYVFSKNDQDEHYINANRLIKLYGVDSDECIIIPIDTRGFKRPKNLIELRPRYDGNYQMGDDVDRSKKCFDRGRCYLPKNHKGVHRYKSHWENKKESDYR